ncbi:MAG: FtsX-like permease family protein [Methanomassiliicoccales archaeon]|jgi:putative ABC transport system permease protein
MSGMGYWQFIWKNLRRRSFRNVATILTFAVVVGSIMVANFLTEGAGNSAKAGMDQLGADLLVVPSEFEVETDAIIITGKPSTFFFSSSAMDEVSAVSGVSKVAPQTFIATLSASCCAMPTQLIAFNSTLDFTVRPWLDNELGRPLQKDEIILGNQIDGGDIGDEMIFFGHPFIIAGLLQPTGTGVDQSIFVQDTDAMAMVKDSQTLSWEPLNIRPDQISAVLVKISPGEDAQEVAQRIEEEVPEVSVISSNHLARKINDQLSGTVGSLYMTAGAVTLVSIPLIATVSILVANERKREIGLLRMMGAKKSFVFQAIMVEALLLAFIGAAIGTVAASLLIMIFKNTLTVGLGIPFLWPGLGSLLVQVWIVMLVAIAISALSALYPAIRASRIDPYDAIRSGQK